MCRMKKMGILGGSFNPPHKGHIQLAKQIYSLYSLDSLLIIPAFLPPHTVNQGGAAADQRLAMSRLAFEPLGFTISDMELSRGGKSYTYDTLAELKGQTDEELYLIIGSDMLLTFDSWYRFTDILKLSHIIAASRVTGKSDLILLQKKAEELNRLYSGRISVCEAEPFPISSTQIREAVKKGEEIGAFVPDSVKQYINNGGLYRD